MTLQKKDSNDLTLTPVGSSMSNGSLMALPAGAVE